ncbi:integrase [Streptomyces mirabilis]|uniref:integrase n=1 Tax=Streptomyces mirabilis TaxID=68239 RepID=UPI0033F37ECF
MTAVAVEDDPYLLPLPGVGTLVVPPERVCASHAHLNSCYSHGSWCLAPLIENPSQHLDWLHWRHCPSVLVEEIKLAAWCLINGRLRPTFVQQRGKKGGNGSRLSEQLGARTVHFTVGEWTRLARWLAKRGVTSLAECDTATLHEYAKLLAVERPEKLKPGHTKESRGRHEVLADLVALSRLWAFDQLSARPCGIGMPPWEAVGVDDYLPAEDGEEGVENSREPLSPATMGPLLIWALRFIDDLAEDIFAAWAETRCITETAEANTTNKDGLAALHAFLRPSLAGKAPLPASTTKSSPTLARQYLAARTGASLSQVGTAADTYELMKLAAERPGPCPLDTPVTGTIAGRPWRESIDMNETPELMQYLGTAAFIVCAYLTGMRPEEVLGLRAGCCPDPEPEDDGSIPRHLIRSHKYKGVLDREGNHLPGGAERDVPWVAITPVVNAIRVLERIVEPGALLFDSGIHHLRRTVSSTGSLRTSSLGRRIKKFVAWVNNEAVRLGLASEIIPPDPHGAVGTSRFRRSLAWHIARQPGGLIALAIQYGHMRTAFADTESSGGYALRGRSGIHDVLAVETALATAETATDLRDRFAGGEGVSGPSARRALLTAASAPRFEGRQVKADFARKYLARDGAVLYDNPHALLLCLYKHDRALCAKDSKVQAPALDRCVPGCANTVRTDQHAAKLRQKADWIEDQVAHTPHELGKRLRANADQLRSWADEHDRTRVTP